MAGAFVECGVTHVVWIPDSETGKWDQAFEDAEDLSIVRACREGEAFGIAAGLHVGGKRPVIIIQCTGLFEAGDSLRNFIHDLRVPLFVLIGYRNYYAFQEGKSKDTAAKFAESIIRSWDIPFDLVEPKDGIRELSERYRAYLRSGRSAAVLLAE